MDATVITVKECLSLMESGQPFACVAVSYDRKRRDKSGEIIPYPEAVLLTEEEGEAPARASRPATRMESLAATIEDIARNPQHSKWYTRNIRLLSDGQPTAVIRKIHPPLLIEFNGRRVVP